MSVPEMAGAATGSCAQCGAAFRCGMEAGDAECWCAGLPPLLPVPDPATAGCLCPACLQARLDRVRNGKVPA